MQSRNRKPDRAGQSVTADLKVDTTVLYVNVEVVDPRGPQMRDPRCGEGP